MVVARLSLLLHKLPSEIRTLTATELDAITYLLHCDEHRRDEETKIAAEAGKMKA